MLCQHYNGSNSFLHVNTVKICQFKTKDQETKPYPLCLSNYSKNFTLSNTQKKQNKTKKKKTGLKKVKKDFPVDYNAIDTGDILDIHIYLMKHAIILGIIKKCLLCY